MIKGSCVCQEVQYEVEEITGQIYNCHCSICRKSHGAAFATQVLAKGETLKFIKGETVISEYKHRLGLRVFCSICGSRLINYARNKKRYLSVALASIDGDFNGKPVADCFVNSKADWYEPSGEIPAFDELPEDVSH
jgi:hypothetical protein